MVMHLYSLASISSMLRPEMTERGWLISTSGVALGRAAAQRASG